MTTSTVALERIAKAYGGRSAVADVDLVLCEGERVALVGHNGAGKSTLIKLMLGLIRPTAGTVRMLGHDPADPAAIVARARIGYLPETAALQPTMTGAELLAFYARLKRRPVAENAAILERVGIADAAHRRIGTYSKGMRQRLALAQTLIGHPRVLLLDEPTSGLDPALRQTLYDIIRQLSAEGATVLVSSHALAELEEQTDRVIVMNEGRKVADGGMAELRRLARRPVRVRLTLRDDRVTAPPPIAGLDWRRVGDRMFEIRCTEQEKVSVLRRVTADDSSIADIAVTSPSLDEIYAHFLIAEAAE
jgi:Cu-processing system ATP-binding protein